MKSSLHEIGRVLFGLHPDFPQLWSQDLKQESLRPVRDILRRYPFLKNFYMIARQESSPHFHEVKALEEQFLQKISDLNQDLSRDEIQANLAALIGLLFFSEDNEVFNTGVKLLKI